MKIAVVTTYPNGDSRRQVVEGRFSDWRRELGAVVAIYAAARTWIRREQTTCSLDSFLSG